MLNTIEFNYNSPMTKQLRIGLISSPVPGHINPMSCIGRELKRRGHEVFFFNIEDTKEKITAEGLNFVAIGIDFPKGAWETYWAPLSKKQGLSVIRKTIKLHTKLSAMMVREIPEIAKSLNLDGLIIDQLQFQGKAIACASGLPFISVACALHMDRDHSFAIPGPVSKRKFGKSFFAKLINRLEWAVMEKASAPILKTGNCIMKVKTTDGSYSELAQIFPMPKSADFPGNFSSKCIHYVGSLIDEDRPSVNFDYDKLDGRPLIYASLGTLQNGMTEIYETIANACKDLDAQVVLALGNWRNEKELTFTIPENMIVVNYAPQLELLAKANLVITHAGMNTAFEAASFGKPMIAIPITNDQPAVARRLEWAGIAKVITLRRLNSEVLRQSIKEILNDNQFATQSLNLAEEIKAAGGVKAAASIIEHAFT